MCHRVLFVQELILLLCESLDRKGHHEMDSAALNALGQTAGRFFVPAYSILWREVNRLENLFKLFGNNFFFKDTKKWVWFALFSFGDTIRFIPLGDRVFSADPDLSLRHGLSPILVLSER